MTKNLQQLIETGARQYRDLVLEVKELENEEDDSKVVEGFATTYNEPYHLFRFKGNDGYTIEFKEEVDRHAFDDTDMSDVIMQYDHQGRVFARQSNGTLELDKNNEKGLYIRANLSGTEIGRQLYQEIKGGYTNKMSFGFTVTGETKKTTKDADGHVTILRTITRIGKLYDVSAVSLPANDATEISSRTIGDGLIAEALKEVQAEEERQRRIGEIRKILNQEDDNHDE